MKETLKDRAYRELCEEIINLEYPPNTLLSEEQICQDLNITRTPVREAIINLQQDKLITVLPKKGLLITPITLETVDNFFEIRLLIEPYLISRYGSNAKKEDLRQLHQHFLESDSLIYTMEDEVRMDEAFHNYIWSLNQNEMLQQLFKQMFFQNQRGWYFPLCPSEQSAILQAETVLSTNKSVCAYCNSIPFKARNTSMAYTPMRLFPSTNG